MSREPKIDPTMLTVWTSEEREEYAVRADEAPTEAVALAAVRHEVSDPTLDVHYLGIRVVNLPEDEGLIGRRRRAHIFSWDRA